MNNILTMESVHTYINQFHILEGIDLSVERNTAAVILGRNGAGKTTTLETIMGLRPASKGTIIFDGTDITKMADYQIPKLGIGFVPENRDIFTALTVEENLKLACRDMSTFNNNVENVFRLFPDLKKYYKKGAGVLSGGQSQMLSIARALINENKLILIDEPSKGLAPLIIQEIVQTIKEIKKSCSIILVEQNFEMASAIGDYYYIMENGKVVLRCDKNQLENDDEIKTKYLGIS
ncbi:MAG: ABC transporter ATP-binding protein [Lachnospiraceae bacterium]|nr:ABC transporter ATP-binding protein [Lachnospiraceae bacterium]